MEKEVNMEKNIDVFAEAGEENIINEIPAKFCRVTPELADKWLERSQENFVNRPLNAATVKKYAKDMENGNWQVNGEPLIFDSNGRLLNGQHRLHAIINSGVPIVTLVVCGVEKDSFKTMDSGRLRAASDLFSTMGVKNPDKISSMAVGYVGLINNRTISRGTGGGTNIKSSGRIGNKNIALYDAYQKNPELFHEVAKFTSHIDSQRKQLRMDVGLTSANVGAYTLYLVQDKNHSLEDVKNFWNDFFGLTSADRKPYSTVVRTREYMKRMQSSALTKLSSIQRQNCIALAWNAMHKKQKPRAIAPDPTEKLQFE